MTVMLFAPSWTLHFRGAGFWLLLSVLSVDMIPICREPAQSGSAAEHEKSRNVIQRCPPFFGARSSSFPKSDETSIPPALQRHSFFSAMHCRNQLSLAVTPRLHFRAGLPNGAPGPRCQSAAKSQTDAGFSFVMRTCLKRYECCGSATEPPDTSVQ
jgi:hypothetical protein